jgi:hypothetical protein
LFKRNKSRRAGKIVLPSRHPPSVLRGMNPRSRFFSTKPACPPSRSARTSQKSKFPKKQNGEPNRFAVLFYSNLYHFICARI